MVAIHSISRIHASNYTHNQMYYNQPVNRTAGLARIFQPYHPMEQYWKSAASGMAGILNSALSVHSSAERLLKPDTSAFQTRFAVLDQVKQLIGDYNELIGGVHGAGDYLNSSVKRSLENAVSGFGNIGISKNADGSLKLDEKKFTESFETRFEYTRDAVTGSNGIAGKLDKTADRISSQQPSSMMNPRNRELQFFAAYQASAGSYFQMPMNGLLYDGFF